jgi:hypothetical protein
MTLERNRRYIVKDTKLAGETFGVFYYPKQTSVFSANRAFRFIGVFDSPPIEPIGNVSSWKNMTIYGDIPLGSSARLYIKSSETVDGLKEAEWTGPYMNGLSGEDISSVTGKIILVRILIDSFGEGLDFAPSPQIDKLKVTAFMMGEEGRFFTKTFDLSFIPKHVILTFNSGESDKSMLQFAIAGKDTSENSEYQNISPNKIVKLDMLPELANKIKLMVRATGSNETPFSMDCFAMIIGGAGHEQFNQQ